MSLIQFLVAHLLLDDGTRVTGKPFGALVPASGEVVFNTAMTGYPESLTDPSYKGQILVLTYPLIGNYGVPGKTIQESLFRNFESDRIHISGLVISSYSAEYSHWNALGNLSDWLARHHVPGISGIDTRSLVKRLRERGTMLGKLFMDNENEIDFYDPNKDNLASQVSIDEKIVYPGNRYRIMLIDCGVKNNIIRCLLDTGATVIRVPWNYDVTRDDYDGLVISNGPGDPAMYSETIGNINKAIGKGKPIFGICLGNQLLALAAGATTYKLKYGHRSYNQPVLLCGTNKTYITSQNHGFAVDTAKLGDDWEPYFVNLNDGTNEGIRHKTKPFFSTQFHPEASGGPTDTRFLFNDFMESVRFHSKHSADKTSNLPLNTSPPDIPASTLSTQISKVLILGSGALKIGEAGEFDYSGSQALKALKQEGIETVLINPNIATIQTSEKIADKVYFLPVTSEFVEKVIIRERPDAILLAFGGQTALNCGVKLYKKGIFENHCVRVLGTPVETIISTEDREIFVRKLDEIGVRTPRSIAVNDAGSARTAASQIGYPVIIRAAFALGGQGSGFCSDEKELDSLVARAFSYSNQILVEESLKGWKEIEYEVVRDRYDNCITVCNMENFDPLGIHTGESIVVAPSQTLSNPEYYKLRELSIRVIRHLGVVGECNIQYALDPDSEDYRVIEVNARLSRSSALASKATGYPLAFVAAKLALGYGLHELKNSVTLTTTACFEPALDYIVCKIPRWDMGKFVGVSKELGSSMKSVGEIMAIGRTFEEAIQKGLRMIGQGMHGFIGNKELYTADLENSLSHPTDVRIFLIAQAFAEGYTVERIRELTKIDRWFLWRLKNIFDTGQNLENYNNINLVPDELILDAKRSGFSDFQLARLIFKAGNLNPEPEMALVREHRKSRNIVPFVRQIDTLAAEYPAQTNYLYLTYSGSEHDVGFSGDRQSVVVLGSGAYRIGSSVEFDWCSVNTLNAVKDAGYRSVMINYNPETVSTDYDICDRLYFDELSFERVMDIIELEDPKGVILSVGGQIPNNLAMRLHKENVPVMGTQPVSVDNAEDRHKFSSMLDRLSIDQPRWKELSNLEDIFNFTSDVGFPVLIRPSYVLSGAAMNVVSNKGEMEHFLTVATNVSKEHPVVVTEFIEEAKEIEIDAVADAGEIVAYAISEHIEFAGVHSGDATIVFPPQKIYVETIRRIKKISRDIAHSLQISGPFNIQFLAKDNDIKVIECNLRASRSFPFVSKVLKINFIDIATRVMLGVPYRKPDKSFFDIDYIGVKASQFSFSRLQKADPMLGVDMASTGEVGCIGDTVYEAVMKSMLSVGYAIPRQNIMISSGPLKSKTILLEGCRMLAARQYNIFATRGTAEFLEKNGISCTVLHWPDEAASPNVMDYIRDHRLDLVINIPKNLSHNELTNDYTIRRAAIDYNIPLITNANLANVFVMAFCKLETEGLEIRAWQEY